MLLLISKDDPLKESLSMKALINNINDSDLEIRTWNRSQQGMKTWFSRACHGNDSLQS